MIIIPCILVVALIRYMVDLLFIVLRHNLWLNHIQLPPPGWELDVIKFVLTLMVAGPIIGVMMASA